MQREFVTCMYAQRLNGMDINLLLFFSYNSVPVHGKGGGGKITLYIQLIQFKLHARD